jgi:hypothetical protein
MKTTQFLKGRFQDFPLFLFTVAIAFAGTLLLSANIARAGFSPSCSFNLFDKCSSNEPEDVGGQLLVEIGPPDVCDTGTIEVHYSNNGGTASAICQIYVDDGACFDSVDQVINGSGTSFTTSNVTPPALPSQSTCSPTFFTDSGLNVGNVNPVSNCINPGEEITVCYNPSGGQSAGDICDNFEACECNIGEHVQAIGSGGLSDAYADCAQPTPTPTATPSATPSPTPPPCKITLIKEGDFPNGFEFPFTFQTNDDPIEHFTLPDFFTGYQIMFTDLPLGTPIRIVEEVPDFCELIDQGCEVSGPADCENIENGIECTCSTDDSNAEITCTFDDVCNPPKVPANTPIGLMGLALFLFVAGAYAFWRKNRNRMGNTGIK